MRKLYCLLFTAAFITFSAHAQFIETGKRIIGGSVGLNFSTVNDSTEAGGNRLKSKNFSMSLSPSYGKAIKPNLVMGYYTSLGYNTAKNEDVRNDNVFKSSGYQLGGGVFLEKFFPLSSRFAFSGRINGGFGYSSFRGNNYVHAVLQQENKSNNLTMGLSLAPALSFKLSQHFLLDFYAGDFVGLSFTNGTTETSGPNTTKVKTTHNNFSVGGIFNNSKSLSNVGFSFRYIF